MTSSPVDVAAMRTSTNCTSALLSQRRRITRLLLPSLPCTQWPPGLPSTPAIYAFRTCAQPLTFAHPWLLWRLRNAGRQSASAREGLLSPTSRAASSIAVERSRTCKSAHSTGLAPRAPCMLPLSHATTSGRQSSPCKGCAPCAWWCVGGGRKKSLLIVSRPF